MTTGQLATPDSKLGWIVLGGLTTTSTPPSAETEIVSLTLAADLAYTLELEAGIE